jgi:hypothetical protein
MVVQKRAEGEGEDEGEHYKRYFIKTTERERNEHFTTNISFKNEVS